jgi:signal transduction histidine kinase/CheY-like chemotaxis protein
MIGVLSDRPMLLYLSKSALIFTAYYFTARFGLKLDAVGGFATLIWAPTGIALAALLILGHTLWPSILIAAFLANLEAGASLPVTFCIAIGNTLEALAGTFLLNKYSKFDPALNRKKIVIGFIVYAALVSTLISATIGTFSLYAGGMLGTFELARTWRAWWAGDILGNLIVAPLILTLSKKPSLELNAFRIVEALAFVFFLTLACVGIFGGWEFFFAAHISPLPYILFLFITWAAIRFGPTGTALSVFCMTAIAVWGTVMQQGPFSIGPLNERLLQLNVFLAVFAIAGLILAAVIAENRTITADLLIAKKEADAANLAKSAFLANMSHEIRTPLGVVMGFAELISTTDVPAAEKEKYALTIKNNGELLSNIISDILDLSKIEAQKIKIYPQQIRLKDFINEVRVALDYQAQEKHITFTINVEKDVPDFIVSDPFRLKQILLNIIGNAIKFTVKGEVAAVVKYCDLKAPKLSIDIRDTGPGIEKDQIGKLFQLFTQLDTTSKRKFGGTGLVLVLSKRLAKLLGGDVSLSQTERNVGSVFNVTIDPGKPIALLRNAEVNGKPEASSSVDRVRPLSGVRILLADDSTENQFLIGHFLESTGARLDTALNGQEAVAKALEEKYDVILMDLQMPVMDGHEATSKLREYGFDGCIIALTAHAMIEERNRCLESGFDEHISKPVSRTYLLQRITYYSNKHHRAQSFTPIEYRELT